MPKKELQLEHVRHSAAHLLAIAVLDLMPSAKLAIGPTIENGFYYDFELPRQIGEDELPKIEKLMEKYRQQDLKFSHEEWEIEKVKKYFKKLNQPYKLELIKDLLKENPKLKKVGLEKTGDKFIDLCRGGHVTSAKQVGPFKLLSTAGAYWRGDEKNKMLTRIYGTAWETKKELDAYLWQLEEAKKRDHKKLGPELEIFTFSSEVGSGLPLWLPKGTILRETLIDFLKKEQLKNGYLPVTTPHIGKIELYQTSGHWQHYRDSIYSPIQIEEQEYILKPMNCPHHIQIYKSSPRSYRDLPLRLAEFGTVYRYEKSGELNGLLRVRGFTVDDAHIFTREEDIEEEFIRVISLVIYVFGKLGLDNYEARLGKRDQKNKKKYVGSDVSWKRAEEAIRSAAKKMKLKFIEDEGEAAFYGPKLDFMVRDAIGRKWQLGTIQIDYNLPERFNLEYIDERGKKIRPAMIHRAPFGSLDRFIGVLIEHYAGAFPFWLSPTQVVVLPVSAKYNNYACAVWNILDKAELRAGVDLSDETLGKKIRIYEKQRIPYILIVGEKEQKNKTVALRSREKGDLGEKQLVKVLKEYLNLN